MQHLGEFVRSEFVRSHPGLMCVSQEWLRGKVKGRGRQEPLDYWHRLCYYSGRREVMHEHIEVVYENGVLRPLGPLPPELQEHQHLTVTIDTPGAREDRLDAACLAAARRDADPSVSLEEVRNILARVPGTLAQAAIAEREER